jgi:peptidoglycan-associated lipoprotein
MRLYNYAFILVTLGACGGKAAKKPTAAAPASPAATAQAVPAAVDSKAVSTNVAVDSDLAAKCKLTFANVDHAPKFGYDEADLTASDRDVLQKVAECVLNGPLKGRTVSLVGRADPRGTSEYNLGLGTQRAESVRTYLQRLGVPAAQLTPTTRGDLDARGNDEASWQKDRRVDLKLGS